MTEDPSLGVKKKILIINEKVRKLKLEIDILRNRLEVLQETEPDATNKILQVESALEKLRGDVKELHRQKPAIRGVGN